MLLGAASLMIVGRNVDLAMAPAIPPLPRSSQRKGSLSRLMISNGSNSALMCQPDSPFNPGST
jgi:hypothetical protein